MKSDRTWIPHPHGLCFPGVCPLTASSTPYFLLSCSRGSVRPPHQGPSHSALLSKQFNRLFSFLFADAEPRPSFSAHVPYDKSHWMWYIRRRVACHPPHIWHYTHSKCTNLHIASHVYETHDKLSLCIQHLIIAPHSLSIRTYNTRHTAPHTFILPPDSTAHTHITPHSTSNILTASLTQHPTCSSHSQHHTQFTTHSHIKTTLPKPALPCIENNFPSHKCFPCDFTPFHLQHFLLDRLLSIHLSILNFLLINLSNYHLSSK